ncbi:MAG TPA: RagB/SusD family nutrient uptake outer membrane protein [Longimicrobiaceae bacterium]|nr:RagB/SusD family nutrient uptake outer membrane protein [Longimicrobiaceae bacterium]
MKKTLLALALLGPAAGLAACDDGYLTEVPYAFVSPENLYTTADGALAALSGAYAAFQADVDDLGIDDTEYYGRHYWMLVEYPTEVMTLRLGATNERTMPDIYRVDPSHNYIIGVWQSAFHAVNRASSVIDNAPKVPSMDPALQARVIAEAKFLRAYHYFNLVRLFGDVPLFLQETKSLADIRKPRSPQADVYRAIISDLESAVPALPARYTGRDVGRVTSGAARALLAKVYLQYGAVGGGGAAAFQQAERWAREVVASGTYSLLPNYASVFDQNNENNAEVIFDIQNTRVPRGGGYMCDQFAPRPLENQANFPWCDSQNPSFGVEWPFYYSYHPSDTRRAGTWLLGYTKKNGVAVTWDSTATAVNAYGHFSPVPGKYIDRTPGAQDGAEEPNFILIRYADVLLSLAEAINENSGPTTEAYSLVNQVRARARVPALAPGLSKQAFKDALFLERRYEFAMEGHGHFDSQRNWAWAKARIEQYSTNAARQFWNRPRPAGCGNCIARDSSVPKVTLTLGDHHRFYPIPQGARDSNPLLTQNPGY